MNYEFSAGIHPTNFVKRFSKLRFLTILDTVICNVASSRSNEEARCNTSDRVLYTKSIRN